MGAIRTSATALLSAGATGAVLALGVLAAPAATAAEAGTQKVTSFGFTLTPSTVAPGGQVVLAVSGCDAASATASSGVFDTVSIERGKTARVTVDRDARLGAQYSVSFTCNGENGSADLTIAGGTSTPTTSSTRTGTATAAPVPVPARSAGSSVAPSAPSAPSARGVRGGLGGSVAGLDPVELGAGTLLFLAAAGGSAYALRRRSAGRSH
ncbi:hypothetical protein OG264_32620 [Streptomyces xanthophaeus]|uniref:hypothetical protein n=1 Tax=Streptomyces xanthophaeus TaxID=67385 RepID=UPI003865F65E|nr:hypothetical protein OG264_32620 [Streptomyces xanthophaeus]WST59186.1 hypothetical protein OG605_05820 [Streptomyces xanthophaeus]